MPFLLATPTRLCVVPPMDAVNSVGVLPKSPSKVACEAGTCQLWMKAKSEVRSSRRDCPKGSLTEHDPGLPVAKYSVPAASSMAGEPQTPAPMQPFGTTLKVCSRTPFVAFSSTNWPCTSGQSPMEATPMYTLPLKTAGELQMKWSLLEPSEVLC